MKSYDETSITSSESMTDLKREVTRFRDSETHSSKYIAELEARLARSDENVLALQQTVDKLEKDVERRRDEVELLQSRLESLRQDGEGWRNDLEERERRVRELEDKMEEWQLKRQDAGDARERLGNVADEVASARRSLEVDLKTARLFSAREIQSREHAKVKDEDKGVEAIPSPTDTDPTIHKQFVALQETHTATLADLSSVTSKYRDALREISDLAAQIQEAKLSNTVISESTLESPTMTERSLELPSPTVRRRMPSNGRLREASDPQYNAAGRRLFFRQAASAESLHSR